MTLLHIITGHLAVTTALESYTTWHGLPSWSTTSMFEAFLRSHHRLLCEIHRRRRQHLLGSGIPDQIPVYSMSFDYIWFTEQTVFGAVGFYFFC